MFKKSLRKQLIFGLTGAIALVWVALAVFVYRDSHSELDRVFDAQLSQSAKLLFLQANHEVRELHEEEEDFNFPIDLPYEQQIIFQIFDSDGRLILKSKVAPTAQLGIQATGFEDQNIWRVYSLSDAKTGLSVRAAQKHEIREKLAREIGLRFLWPLVFVLPLTAALVWMVTHLLLRSLFNVTKEVSLRDSKDLDPIDLSLVPAEVQPLVAALNLLFSRVEKTLTFERRFTSDAAHELRTPLAGIRLQAEIAQTALGEERSLALTNLLQSVDRLAKILSQLLLLARLESSSKENIFSKIDMSKLSRQILADLGEKALEKGIELGLEGTSDLVNGSPELLGILLRNLFENAIRHTPRGGEISAQILRSESGLFLVIEDSGPGVHPSQFEGIFEAFYRGENKIGEGSGLGLSIAKRIAELHGASLTASFSDKLGGLKMVLSFPS